MTGMSRKDIATALQGLADQGCELVPKKNGTVVRFPDGGHTSFHYSQSDTNDRKYSRALIRRHGLTWPLDGESRKKDNMATRGRPRNEEKWAKVRLNIAAREAQGFRHHDTHTLSKATGENSSLVRRILTEDGYSYNETTHIWSKPTVDFVPTQLKPVEIEPKLVVPGYGAPYFTAPPRPHVVASDEQVRTFSVDAPHQVDSPLTANSGPLADKKPEAKTEQNRPTEREFIDTHDSWAIDNFVSIKDLTVSQLVAAYHAAGLELELRVWRKS